MQVVEEVGEREEHAVDVIGDLLGDRAVGIAREGTVEIAIIDR